MEFLDNLRWRYATKKFDPSQKLTAEELNKLTEAVNLAPSSFGLQPFKVLIIEDEEIREKLKRQAWGQPQITDASQVIVFAAINNLSEGHVDEFIKRISEVTGAPESTLEEYRQMMKVKISSASKEELLAWASKQAYIALGFLLSACAQLRIDACPMEGFDPQQFDDILGLKEHNLNSVVMATVGFRSEEDKYQHNPKVRKELSDLVLRYQ